MSPTHLDLGLAVYRSSRWKSAIGALGCLSFVLLGWWLLHQPLGVRGFIAGWLSIIFFGLVAPLWVSAILQPNRLTLHKSGFSVKQALFPEKNYEWSAIDQLWALHRPITPLVVWTYKERPKRLGGFKKLIGQPNDYDGYLPAGWRLPADELAALMNAAKIRKS